MDIAGRISSVESDWCWRLPEVRALTYTKYPFWPFPAPMFSGVRLAEKRETINTWGNETHSDIWSSKLSCPVPWGPTLTPIEEAQWGRGNREATTCSAPEFLHIQPHFPLSEQRKPPAPGKSYDLCWWEPLPVVVCWQAQTVYAIATRTPLQN